MQHTTYRREDSQMMNLVVAGIVGATVATVATAMTNKKNRQRLREAIDYVMDRSEEVRDLASRAWEDAEEEMDVVRTKVKRQANRVADRVGDKADEMMSKTNKRNQG